MNLAFTTPIEATDEYAEFVKAVQDLQAINERVERRLPMPVAMAPDLVPEGGAQ